MLKPLMACVLAGLLSPAVGLACQFDTDCDVGSKCLTARGQIKGVCVR